LSRAAFPVWRNTCLYRAVAECLVLRRYGVPCRLELGVARLGPRGWGLGAGDDEAPKRIMAHAWVVRADVEVTTGATATLAVRRGGQPRLARRAATRRPRERTLSGNRPLLDAHDLGRAALRRARPRAAARGGGGRAGRDRVAAGGRRPLGQVHDVR